MSEDRFTIEQMMTVARDLGRISARTDAVERAMDGLSARLDESIGRHTSHLRGEMRGELARIEQQMRSDRENVASKIAASESALKSAIASAVQDNFNKAAIARAEELRQQNITIAGQLATANKENRWLIIGIGLLIVIGGKAIEYLPDMIDFIERLRL